MIAWMFYTVLVSVLVVLGARAVESIGRGIGYPVRWVWACALVLLVALTVLAPYRGDPRPLRIALPTTYAEVTTAPAAATSSWADMMQARIDEGRRAFNGRIDSVTRAVERNLPRQTNTIAFVAWTLITLTLVLLFALVQLRFRRARRDWPLADVQGVRVRVAPNVGPVVIGVARPEIVVPHWLLGRAAHEQQLVVAHEAEHVRARDTLLLGAGCVVAAAMPWNPVVWYILSRLRLAVELDCDARVLRAGVAPHSYGALLIDVAENNSGFRLSAPALADDSSHLHQRIMAMNAVKPKFALVRGGVFGAMALVAVLAACEAKMPTSADVDGMDAKKAEAQAVKLAMLKSSDSTVYLVDGRTTDMATANAIAPPSIDAIEVKKTADGRGVISIRTKEGSPDRLALDFRREQEKGQVVMMRKPPKSGDTTAALIIAKSPTGAATPLLYIDGVKKPKSALETLNRQDIESVEVLKGGAAATFTNDPEAVNGVILIKTKKGGSK